VLQAHHGELPPDAHVLFANTGREHDATLRFVHAMETAWNVRFRWLERVGGGGSSRSISRGRPAAMTRARGSIATSRTLVTCRGQGFRRAPRSSRFAASRASCEGRVTSAGTAL